MDGLNNLVIQEVIQMSVGLIQYSNLIPGALMNVAATFAMSKHFRHLQAQFMIVLIHTYFQSMIDCGEFE